MKRYKIDIKKAVESLSKQGVILYPTDTVWGLGCDATDRESVLKIYKIKKREFSKSLIVLVSSIEMLREYVELIPEKALEIIKNEEKSVTIIYPHARKLATNAISDDGTVAIRIPKDDFCISLINEFQKPIISTSANISGEIVPQDYMAISSEIKRNVDYIVNYRQDDKKKSKPSVIIKIEKNEIIYLRK